MERLFFREQMKQMYEPKPEGAMLDRQKFVIGVAGIGMGAGATFTAMGLAFRMGEMTSGVTYIEGKPHEAAGVSPYRLLAVDGEFRRIAERKEYGTGRLNLYKKVNWKIHKPQKVQDAQGEEQDYRQVPGKIIIVDSPVCFGDVDMAVAVADPFPPRITAGLNTFKELRELDAESSALHRRVLWLINKSDGGMARRETERFLKLKFDFEQIMLPGEVFYKAAYSCSQPFFICETEGINHLAAKILSTI